MIVINGVQTNQEFQSLADAVATISTATSGIAAALNNQVIPRSQWEQTPVLDGSRIEIVTAVQGG